MRIPGTSDCAYPLGLEARLERAIGQQMKKSMRAAEISCLGDATRLRSAGLALARSGAAGAAEAIAQARSILERGSLGEEARTFGFSVQAPAEAYIDYKAGLYRAASRKLRTTLELLGCLAVRYGHDVTVRRAHIGRNLLVTLRLSGDFSLAGDLATGLMMWICGASAWPLDQVETGLAELAHDEREAATDQLVAELGHVALASASTIDLHTLQHADFPDTPLCWRVRAFLSLLAAYRDGDPAALASAESRCAELGCGSLWHMRRSVVDLVGER